MEEKDIVNMLNAFHHPNPKPVDRLYELTKQRRALNVTQEEQDIRPEAVTSAGLALKLIKFYKVCVLEAENEIDQWHLEFPDPVAVHEAKEYQIARMMCLEIIKRYQAVLARIVGESESKQRQAKKYLN